MKTNEKISREHLLFLKGIKRRAIKINAIRIAIFVIFLMIWELSYRIGLTDGFIFSSPSRIALSLYALASSGDLIKHSAITLYETLLGFIIASAGGTLIALLMWFNETVRKIAEPYLVVLNSLPKIALGPLIIIWFGSGRTAIVVMAVLITVIVTVITMLAGFISTDENKILLMKTLGANKFQILAKLVLPSSIPSFISMLKINIGLSWIGSIMGEYLVSEAGIGYLIVYGGQVFRLDLVYASTLVLCILATGMYALVSLAERKINSKRK